MKITVKSGARTDCHILAHNCPLLSSCGVLVEGSERGWILCHYFCGCQDVNKDLLVVRCKYPVKH